MPAGLQEILALAIVAVVAGLALLRRLRASRRGACHDCYASTECAISAPTPEPAEPLVRIQPRAPATGP